MLIFPMKAKYFCALLIGIQLYMGFFSPSATLAWGHLGAMFSAFLFMVIVSSPKFKNLSEIYLKKRKNKSKANLKLVDDDDENGPKHWH